jgi:hypothetical protein
MRHLIVAAMTVTSLTACDLYWDSKPDPCSDIKYDYGADALPSQGRINPYTGSCEFGSSPNPCYDGGGLRPEASPVPQQDWPSCDSQCTGLIETDCLKTPACRANYTDNGNGNDDLSRPAFDKCTAVAPSGPVHNRQACSSMDAYTCSLHDDCSSIYSTNGLRDGGPEADAITTRFLRCADEAIATGCYSNADCGPGYDCTADTECLPPPDCKPGDACPPVCYGRCVKTEVVQCDPQSCPTGTVCVIACPDPGMGLPGTNVDGSCSIQCIPEQNSCAVVDCAEGFECVEKCQLCPPNADCSGEYLCRAECVPVNPVSCDQIACEQGSHCEVNCWADPDGGNGAPGDRPMDGCSVQCVPDQVISCANVLCGPGTHCEERCNACDPIPGGPPCAGQCEVACVPDGIDPGTCDSRQIACDALPPSCPVGTVPGVRDACWTGFCIPLADCGPLDPGTCGDALCDSLPPACPAETVPGVRNGCWSGYCIPQNQCGGGTESCEALTTESACTGRADCTPVYTGSDCTCFPWGCSCETTTYARCQTGDVMPPAPR